MDRKKVIKNISEIGIFVSVAILFNFSIFKIKITPDAGSISFVMIPLFIIAIRHNFLITFISCSLIYGIPACLIGGHGFQYFPFDYFLAYGGIAVISLFRNLILKDNWQSYLFLIISAILATLIRYVSACASSMIYYDYSLKASLIYNSIYVLVSGLIGLIALIILLRPLKIINDKHEN